MTKRLFVSMAAMGIAGGMAFSANAETLTWNGARGARWNDANWLDAGNNPAAWQDGADADTDNGGAIAPGGAMSVPLVAMELSMVATAANTDVRVLVLDEE